MIQGILHDVCGMPFLLFSFGERDSYKMNRQRSSSLHTSGILFLAFFLVMVQILPSALAEETDEDLLLLARINNAFATLVNRALPSIVQIDTTKTVTGDPHSGIPNFPFRFRGPREREATALGSGVIVSEDGYILTNNHVIEEADNIRVSLADGRQFDATLVGTDKYTEIAVIKIDSAALPALLLGDSELLRVGEWVIAIGSPFHLEQTVTRGVVSAKGRSNLYIIDNGGYEDFIQTDAAINPGNSGGALINIEGKLIGINTAILTGGLSRSNAGVGFAVPINMARNVMEAILRDGRVVRGWLGVGIKAVDEDIAKELGLKQTSGALVTEIFSGPAKQAGVEPRDVIVRFNGHPIGGSDELRSIVASTPVNRAVKMEIIRKGETKTLTVEVAERTETVLAEASRGNPDARENFRLNEGPMVGVEVQTLTPELSQELGYEGEEGVLVTRVEPGSPAGRAGIEVGDLIQEAEMRDVRNTRDLSQAVLESDNRSRLILYVRSRTGEASYVVLTKGEEPKEEPTEEELTE